MEHILQEFFRGLPLWLNALAFAAGMGITMKGGDWFTDSAVQIAEATHVPKAVIGATVVSMATTFPEFAVSFTATALHKPQTAIGNSVGSVVCNIGLIVGSCVLFRSMKTHRGSLTGQACFMLAAGVLVVFFSRDGTLSRPEGAFLLVLMGAYLLYSVWLAHRERQQAFATMTEEKQQQAAQARAGMSGHLVWFLVGAAGVVVGSNLMVLNVEPIARALGVPELIIALTLVALGTSLPEYVVALMSTVKGHAELSIGNIVGANFLDIAWVLGACTMLHPLPIERQTRILDFPFMLLLMGAVFVFGRTQNRLHRWEGGVLLGVYVVYVGLMINFFGLGG